MGDGPFDDEEQEGQWWQQLPLVPAVTGVLLRQQTADDGSRRRWHICLPVCLDSRKFITSLGGNGSMFSSSGRTNVSATASVHCSPPLLCSSYTIGC
jgi:hypothetical protein